MATPTTTTASDCPQCFFTAASTTLLAFPLNTATISIRLLPTVSIGSDAKPTTYYNTIFFTSSSPPNSAATSTIYYTDVSQLTWTTLGTILSAPTTYVHYLSFLGAAFTEAGCVSTLVPSILSNPTSASPAALVYPLNVIDPLPSALLSYLDSQPDFVAQLGNRSLESCVNVPLQTPTSFRSSTISASIFASSTLVSTTSSSASSSNTGSSLSQPANSLPAGTSAGIGVGTAIGVILLVGLCIILLLRLRRRRQQQPKSVTTDPDKKALSLYEADGTRSPPQELDPQFIAEMQHPPTELQQPLTELDVHAQRRAELEGSNAHEMPSG